MKSLPTNDSGIRWLYANDACVRNNLMAFQMGIRSWQQSLEACVVDLAVSRQSLLDEITRLRQELRPIYVINGQTMEPME
ncbi:MAG: hypothetical protein KGL39_28070 [Patescibacteria group bacterium]|nr:hypothetical protein [Patescibacteria group bacterium]